MNKKLLFRSNRRRYAFLIFIAALLPVFITIFAMVDNSRVAVDRQTVTVPSLPGSLEGATILLISDLHGLTFGEDQGAFAMALASNRVDAVVFAGDMLGPSGDDQPFHALVESLAEKLKKPMFFIAGDEDSPIDEQTGAATWSYSQWIMRAQELGAVYLDAPQKVKIGSGTLWVMNGLTRAADISATRAQLESRLAKTVGDTTMTAEERALEISHTRLKLDAAVRAEAALAEVGPSDVQVGVLHNPLTDDFVRDLSGWQPSGENGAGGIASMDVLLAGHYCGGGVRLPLIGALHVPAPRLPREGWRPPAAQTRGNNAVGGVQQVITPGLGVSALQKPLRARLFNTPAVTLVRLTARWQQ